MPLILKCSPAFEKIVYHRRRQTSNLFQTCNTELVSNLFHPTVRIMSELEPEIEQEDIAQRHRREKRLLQNRIQSLKKSSGKSDKKKKREIDELISRLESDLEQTHIKELHLSRPHINGEEPKDVQQENQTSNDPQQRVSKAQRRRDKKAAEESARDKLIAEQEKANRNGPRIVEMNKIKETLKSKDVTVYMIPSNGDCLYSAVSHQLTATLRPKMTVDELRKVTADHIRNNKNDFAPFLCNLDSGDMLSEEQFQKYCDDVMNTNAWGGQVELQALSAVLECPIHIVQSTLPSVIVQGEEFASKGEPLILTYHRHMFGLGEHYNSTQKIISNGEGSDENSL